jgi:Arc/MetJ family transcription regulator
MHDLTRYNASREGNDLMRTTIHIDPKLLKDAKRITGETSPSKAVNAALRELVRRRKLRELRDMLGTLNFKDDRREMEELELKEMRQQRG